MASRSLDSLKPDMALIAQEVIDRCKDRGVELLVYCTLRSPEEQARLFRRSRTLKEIETKAELFRLKGYDFLADILMDVGPQPGKLGAHVTNAGPGESFHQYGKAFDAVPMQDGKCLWDNDWPQWLIYGDMVKAAGIYWAGSWRYFPEYPHAQDSPTSNPLKVWGADQVAANIINRSRD